MKVSEMFYSKSRFDQTFRPGLGIVSLLKSEDLTVMAALLEETELDKSIDKQGQSISHYFLQLK